MIDQQQLIQLLQSLHQKNSQDGGAVSAPIAQTPQFPAGKQGHPLQALGFLGGLGDTQNAQGGIDPSMLTVLNQGIQKQLGNGDGNQPFPWQQQPQGQQMGQNVSSGIGGIMKLLSSFL